ncbi:MAG TPA: MBL fold metallo-hydrolase [Hyphomicrobiales bacterium]|nr:MBL fold metallo-hydrolase [Hyphomicrobiales bacterium]
MTAADDLVFDRSAEGAPGEPVRLSPLVRRVLAPNPSAFTFTGTQTHLVGHGRVAVIDPGPDDPAHVAALLAALRGEIVEAIVVTHTHRDHTGAVAALAAETGAPVVGCAPMVHGEGGVRLDAGGDSSYRPARILADGEAVAGPGWTLTAVATPGHTSNHLAFALAEEAALFSGDHVMAWSTTVVAPPDGDMASYRGSLDKLINRPEDLYYPAHGPAKSEARAYVAGLLKHRRFREAQIVARLKAGDRAIPAIVAALYRGLDPRLVPAAGMSVLAHLRDLEARGIVAAAGEGAAAAYRLT